MDLRSGHVAILMVYVAFGVITRNLVYGGNESTTTEKSTNLTSTTLVQLTTSLGTVPVNISSTTISALGTSVSSTTSGALGTSISSTTLSATGTSISSTTLSATGSSVSSTTLSALGTPTFLTTRSSSTATASGPILLTGTTPVNISSTTLSALGILVSSTTLSATGTSISSTTLSATGTSISSTTLSATGTFTSLATKSSSTVTASGVILQNKSMEILETSCLDMSTPCMNNGTCLPVGTCQCPSSWTGRRCDYPCSLDACPSELDVCIMQSKCNVNGTAYCYNKTECLCFPGWYGSFCNISVCDNYYCYNGGKCRNSSGIAVCDCVPDATGPHCEHNVEYSCYHMPSDALNHTVSCIDNIGYYTLVCKPEWTGKNCDVPINRTEFCRSNECDLQHIDYCNAVCEAGNCSNIMMEKPYDYTGYSYGEQYDDEGTDPQTGCNFTLGNPWNMCNRSNCIERFANGLCDFSCNDEGCLYDGYDCILPKGFLQDCSLYFNTPCSYNLTFDGQCNTECNTTDCLYDGFDCAFSGLAPLPGQLVIHMQPINHIKSVVRKIGLLLRSGVNKTFSTKNGPDSIVVYLQLTCSALVNKKCFTSIQSAAKFLAAYVAKLNVPGLYVKNIFACEDGYYGYQGCQNKCSEGCKNSSSREICDKDMGECLDGCTDEFYGSKCDAECNNNCVKGVGRRCHEDSGDCIYSCNKGFYGPQCNHVCSDKCLASCDNINGTCIGGCQGNLSYGLHCEEQCPRQCQNSTCDHLGNCRACVIGYHGDNCTKPCPKGCSGGCYQSTGYCFTCKADHHGKNCEPDAVHKKITDEASAKMDYTGVIVGVVASVFIIAGAVLIAFLCWRRKQSGDYILDAEAGASTTANQEAATIVQEQHSHMAHFASSKDAIDLDDTRDNGVYTGRSHVAHVKSTDQDELTENSPEAKLGNDDHSQIQSSVEINLTTDLDESSEKFLNSGSVDLKLPPPDYEAATRDTDHQSSDGREDEVTQTSGLLVAGGAPLAASEASLLSRDTLDEPPQPDNQFVSEDANLPQISETDANKGNNSDEEEEEKETKKSRSSSSSSNSSSDNN